MSFNAGENIGPYRILEQLGQGGMATVYKAYHASLDRYVAIKVLHPAFKEDNTFEQRFQREARVVARLEHPHIVPVYDYAEHEKRPYLVMKYIEGDTLKARLGMGPLSSGEIRRIVDAVGSALAYAHKQGILHRDIKPSNVLVASDGQMYLADFGLARIAQSGESTLSSDMIMGTPQYISPEQAMGDPNLDARTDVYSLGVVVYELLVGRVPYQADTPYAVVHDHIYTPLPLPRSINARLPEPLERFLLKALSKDRGDRYQSVEEMLTALNRAVEESGLQSPGSVSTVVQPAAAPTLISAQATPSPAAAAMGAPPPDAPSAHRARKPASPLVWIGLGALIVAGILVVVLLARPKPTPASPSNQNPPAGTSVSQANPPPDAGQNPQRVLEEAGALFKKGNEQAAQSRPEEARATFTQAAETAEQALGALSAPGTPAEAELHAHVLAAESWLASGHPERAEPHFNWLVESAEDKAGPLSGLALSHLLQNRVEDALHQVEEALRLNPDLAEAHAIKGCGLLKSGDRVAALREFRLAVSDKPATALIRPWVMLVLERLECRPER